MHKYTFTLKDKRGYPLGAAALMLASDAAARDLAAIHLGASTGFQQVEISKGSDVVFIVSRDELDTLGRPRRDAWAPARAA